MINLKEYQELTLDKQKEYIESLLENKFKLSDEFDGVLSKKTKVTHIECGESQYVRITGLLPKKNKCDHCYRIERENNFKEIISPQLELIGDYINNETPVKVRVKKCNHTITVVPHAATKTIKNNKTIKCEECIYEQKKETLKKYIAKCCLYKGEYTLYSLDKEPNTPIGVKHNKCGEVEYYSYKQILMKYIDCKVCRKDATEENFKHKLKHKYNIHDYKLKSKYNGPNKHVILKHECGCDKYVLPSTLSSNTNLKCRWCNSSDFYNTEEVKTFLFYKKKGEYQLVKEYDPDEGLLHLKKRTCNHKFSIKANKFFNKIHCPICKKEVLWDKRHKEFVKKVENKYKGKYAVLSRFKGYRYLVDVVHLECGEIFSERAKILLAENIKEPCCKCNKKKDNHIRRTKFEKRLNEKFNGEIILLGDFTHQKEVHRFKNKVTKEEFEDKPYLLLKRRTKLKAMF